MCKMGPTEHYKVTGEIENQAPTQAINRPTQSDLVISAEICLRQSIGRDVHQRGQLVTVTGRKATSRNAVISQNARSKM